MCPECGSFKSDVTDSRPASVDGKDFYYLGNAMTEAANEGEGVAGLHRFLSPGFIGKGRYVKIIFVPAGAFIFSGFK